MREGFSAKKYIDEQSKYILERIASDRNERLYLEFGGKLVHDKHAKRVLPGFDENAKIKLLMKMKEQAEIIICIYSGDIITNKVRHDFGITYDFEVFRLIDIFRKNNLTVNSVVVTRYVDEPAVRLFMDKLERYGIKAYKHYHTKGYPTDVDTIVSDEGYGANPYIKVEKPIVVVTGPGGGSGKLATCLSQLYHEYKLGNQARYAKFETFPIWSIPLKHPVNIAYEAATADLKDVNMIDSFHLEAYGVQAVNYNRDLEAFPVVKRIIEKITKREAEYKSPTDMGVNRAGFSIINDEVCKEAAKQEIIRRNLVAQCDFKRGKIEADTLERCDLLMKEVGAKMEDRKCLVAARLYSDGIVSSVGESGVSMAIQLKDGKLITGRSSKRMVAAAAAVLNAIKYLAKIDDDVMVIEPQVFSAIQDMRSTILNQEQEKLSLEDVLSALAISATRDKTARIAEEKLKELAESEAHCTAILSEKDENALKAMGINVTCDPEFITNNLYFE